LQKNTTIGDQSMKQSLTARIPAYKHLQIRLLHPVIAQSNPKLEIGTHVIEVNSLTMHPKFILMIIKSLEISQYGLDFISSLAQQPMTWPIG